MSWWLRCLALSLLLIIISACAAQDTPSVQIEPTFTSSPSATPLPTPEIGKASVTGQIVGELTNEPMAETIIRLAEVYREDGSETEGAYVLDVAFSPGDISDDRGYILIENITPGEYVIVIGDPYGAYEIIENEDGTAKVWEMPIDQITDVGVIKTNP